MYMQNGRPKPQNYNIYVGRFKHKKIQNLPKISKKMFTKDYSKIEMQKNLQNIHGQALIHVSARNIFLEVCTSMKIYNKTWEFSFYH